MQDMLNRTAGSERRQFRRIKTTSPIEYRFFNEDKSQFSITCDISEGGICFMTDGPLALGTPVHFQVKLRHKPMPLYGIARVAWTHKDYYSERYRVGLEFTEVGSVTRTDISAFIAENKTACFSS